MATNRNPQLLAQDGFPRGHFPSFPEAGVGADLLVAQEFEQGVHIGQLHPAAGKDHDVFVGSNTFLGEKGGQILGGFRIAVDVQAVIPVDVDCAGNAAQVKIRQTGLKLGGIAYIHHASEPHTVIAQDPPPDSVVSREMETSLLVSLGPEPMTFVTPSLAGKTFAAARVSLQSYGIQMGAARLVKEPGAPPDSILSQSPAPGTPLTRRDVVQVSVNRP